MMKRGKKGTLYVLLQSLVGMHVKIELKTEYVVQGILEEVTSCMEYVSNYLSFL